MQSLDLLHSQGIIHTDMKVDNILLNQIHTEVDDYINQIKTLHISEDYQKTLQESLTKEISLLDKKRENK